MPFITNQDNPYMVRGLSRTNEEQPGNEMSKTFRAENFPEIAEQQNPAQVEPIEEPEYDITPYGSAVYLDLLV